MNLHELIVKAGLAIEKWYVEQTPSRATVDTDPGSQHRVVVDGISPKSAHGIVLY
jgi:hypothetical protein